MTKDGTGLLEILVALALMLTVSALALSLYERTRRGFVSGAEQAHRQQAVRAAFDTLARELRLAGYNVNPDGDPDRPDEAIEAAFETAIVLRADLDADSGRATTPETALAGGAFPTVSTGNDEIVAYALARPDGSGPHTLTFDADVVPAPRDGRVETVSLEDVALVHDDPPYTLYRLVVRSGSTSGRRSPVIDGVRSLRLVYFDREGVPIPPPGGTDDPDGAHAAARASIRRVGIEIEARGTGPARTFSTVRLTGDVTPRNLGRSAIEDRAD